MTRRLFVCHATADIEATSELVDALENALNFSAGSLWTSGLPGYSVDPNDMPALGAALAGSDVVLALVTRTSALDAQFHFQLGAGWALGAHTVLFVLEAAAQELLPSALSQASVMRGHEPSQWSELIGDLSVRLGLVPRPGASSPPVITPSYPPGSLTAPPPAAAPVIEHSPLPPLPAAAPASRAPLPAAAAPTRPRVPPLSAAAPVRAPSVPPLPAAMPRRAVGVPPLPPAAPVSTASALQPLAAQTLSEAADVAEPSGSADANTRELAQFSLDAHAGLALEDPAHADLSALAGTSDDADTRELAYFSPNADDTKAVEARAASELASLEAADASALASLRIDAAVSELASLSLDAGDPLDASDEADASELAQFSDEDDDIESLQARDDADTRELPHLTLDAIDSGSLEASDEVDTGELPHLSLSAEDSERESLDDDASIARLSLDAIDDALPRDSLDNSHADLSEPATTPKAPIIIISGPAATEIISPELPQQSEEPRLQPRAAAVYPSVTPQHSYIDELRAIGSDEEPAGRTPPRSSYIEELQTLDPQHAYAAEYEEPDTREQLRIAARQSQQDTRDGHAELAQAAVIQASDSDVFARLPTCQMALEAGRAVSDCMFNRDEIDDFGSELDVPLGRLIECLGVSWTELRGEQDLDTWVAVTDHLLETLPDEVRKVEEWYRVGYELATLHNLAGQLVLDGSDAAAEQHWRSALERFLLRAERAEIDYENLGRVLGLLENLVGPSHERDLSNIPRSLEELRRYAAGADIHTAA